jgi:tetratricopeptide (TPR) repeat protein
MRTKSRVAAGLAATLGLILLTPRPGSGTDPKTPHQLTASCTKAGAYLVAAQEALSKQDPTAALEPLKHAVEIDPKCSEGYLLLGLAEFQRGETDKSIQQYKRALDLQPRSYSAHYNLALSYLREHNLRDARVELEKAVTLGPRNADAQYDLGIVLLELREPSRALAHLRRARALKPRPDVAFNIVRAALESNQIPQARSEAETSAKSLGSDVQWTAAVGQLFLKNAQPKDAIIYLGQANRISPENEDIRRQLAAAYLESGQAQEVLSAIREPKTSEDYYLRGSAYYLLHQFQAADRESEQALALAPENPQILVLRTRLLQRAGQQNGALELANKATSLSPNWDEPHYLAGVSYYFIRHYEEAAQSLARARELNPNSSRAFFLEAIALANRGKTAEAEQCLRRAIALQPGNARFYCHLGILLTRGNRYPEAEASLRKAIQLKPEYALSHYELGKLLVYSNQLPEAAQELEQAVTRDPALSAAYYQLGRVYARLGEKEKSAGAITEFQRLYKQEANASQDTDQEVEEDTRQEIQ